MSLLDPSSKPVDQAKNSILNNRNLILNKMIFWVGLCLIIGYWYLVHPVGFGRTGYIEDMCIDLGRHVMANQLKGGNGPTFFSDRLGAPSGMPIAFFSWSIEREWLGAYIWQWSKDFPFIWVYFGVSLLVSYLGVGTILRRMGLESIWAWGLSIIVILCHIPRHFKIWHHAEHLMHHWVYLSLFLDAWIWQRFYREKKFSWNLELWRVVCMLGTFGTTGYYWGPMIYEWALVRTCMLSLRGVRACPKISWASCGVFWPTTSSARRKKCSLGNKHSSAFFLLASLSRLKILSQSAQLIFGQALKFWEWRLRQAILPVFLILGFLVIELRWFIPLSKEVLKLGTIQQGYGWFAHLGQLVRPLWLDLIFSKLPPIDTPETVITIGWLYWVPFFLAVRKSGKRAVLPFLILLVSAILYACIGKPFIMQKLLQFVVPFMKFFRVGSRWGLLMPEIVMVIIVLALPDKPFTWDRKSRLSVLAVWAFVLLSVVEMRWLFLPVTMMPPLPEDTVQMMDHIRKSPGSTVLDLPFCVAGGNNICTEAQCPQYPLSTVGQCFSTWHEKKVYGIYQSRLVKAECEVYNRPPFISWFSAWKEERCFRPEEWKQFCDYLKDQDELSSVLLYPDIWRASGNAECLAQFDLHLGDALDAGHFMRHETRGGVPSESLRVLRYGAKCKL